MSEILKDENSPEASGWTRRFIACEPKLSEAIELYRDSGFDVLLVNLPSGEDVKNCNSNMEKIECRECFDGVENRYRIIFTRPKNPPS
jgi:hypothetical protein